MILVCPGGNHADGRLLAGGVEAPAEGLGVDREMLARAGVGDCRVRLGNAAENLSRVRRIALMLLKREKGCRLGVKSKRKKAAWDRDYLLTVLGIV